MTRAAFSFRSRLDTIVVPKGDMHQSTLVRRHGTKLHAAVLTRRSIGGRTGDRLELLTLTTLVSFDVDNHRIAKPDGAHRDSRNQELQGVKRLAVTTDEYGKIITGNVQDELSIVTFVFVDSYFSNVEILQNVLQSSDGRIGYPVEFLIGQFLLFFGIVSISFFDVQYFDLFFQIFFSHFESPLVGYCYRMNDEVFHVKQER